MDFINPDNFKFPRDFFRFFDDGEDIDEVGEYEIDISYTYMPSESFNSNNTSISRAPINISPSGPPPFSNPSKNNKNVQNLNFSYKNSKKGFSSNSLAPCLYRYTYIWQKNGFSYWAYLTSLSSCSISGWRWIGFRWVYFGVDYKRIDSFICY